METQSKSAPWATRIPPIYQRTTKSSRREVVSSHLGFPGSSVGKKSACSTRDLGSIPILGRSPREGNGNPFQYSYLKNPTDRGAWWATVCGGARVGHDWAPKPPQAVTQSCPTLRPHLLTQEMNLGLLHCRQILYHLSHQGRFPNRMIMRIMRG